MVVDEIEFNQTGLDFYTTRFMIKLQIQLIISEIKNIYIYIFEVSTKLKSRKHNVQLEMIHHTWDGNLWYCRARGFQRARCIVH